MTEFELAKDGPSRDQLTVRSEWYLKGLADESFVVRDSRGAILFSLTVSNVDRVSTGPEAVGAIAADGSRVFVSSGDFRRYHLYPLDADEVIRLVDEAGFALTEEERARYGVE